MSDQLLISTRKGLFSARRTTRGGWALDAVSFLGDNVSLAMADPRDGAWYAALDHGHFGAKLHRSRDRGATWTEIGVPAYPTPPEGHIEKDFLGREIPWRLIRFWALTPGLVSQAGLLWAGTIPGGLFRSEDHGDTWSLVEPLWHMPERRKWAGGGADAPGLHSICVDPRNGNRVAVAISSGGVWITEDCGKTWTPHTKGMRADYAPPELVEAPESQDPHHMVQCPGAPDSYWIQHHNGIFRSTDGALNLSAARQPRWSAWLKRLQQTNNLSLKVWVLARQVEAGDYTAYPAFQSALYAHLLSLSTPGGGKRDQIIHDPPRGFFFGDPAGLRTIGYPLWPIAKVPGALHIARASIFYQWLRKALLESPDRKLNAGLYAVWCYNTQPDQRDLILELASHVQPLTTPLNPEADPWNDPRFWIVTDWAMAWGTQKDSQSIHTALTGTPQAVFDRLTQTMEAVPGFFTPSRPALTKPGSSATPPPRGLEPPLGSQDRPWQVDFREMKVLDHPPAPHYPQEALARRMMTTLVLDTWVDPKGTTTACRPEPGPWLGFFGPTGVSYAMRWRFGPALFNGTPMYSKFHLTIPFRLR